jgi:DNA-binding beta-propeller fold protein YncE
MIWAERTRCSPSWYNSISQSFAQNVSEVEMEKTLVRRAIVTVLALATATFVIDGCQPTTPTAQYFVYVGNRGSNNVSAYTINPRTGALSATRGSPFLAGKYPAGIAADPTGKFLYVGNSGDNNVSAFTINPHSGALSAISGSPFPTGSYPAGVVVDPTGKFLYVGNNTGNNVSAYTINTATGALSAVTGAPFDAGQQPTGVSVDPTGKFLYVTNAWGSGGGQGISVYRINSSSGALSTVKAASSALFAAGTEPVGAAVDPTGKFLYVTNHGENNTYIPIASGSTVSAYTINSTTGAISAVSGSPFPAVEGPWGIAIDPTGKLLYITNTGSKSAVAVGGNTVSAYTIDSSSGALSAVSGSPFLAGKKPHDIAIDPRGKFLYVTNNAGNNLSAYTINSSTGALTAVGGSPFAAGTGPWSIAVTTVQGR